MEKISGIQITKLLKKQTIVELSEIDKSFIINQAKILKTDNFLKLIKQETQIAKSESTVTPKKKLRLLK